MSSRRRPDLAFSATASGWRWRGVGTLLLCAALLVVPLLRGGVHWYAQIAAGTLVALALLLDRPQTRAIPWLALPLAFVAVVIGFQTVPVWPGLHRWLSPAAASLFRDVLGPIGAYPAFRPLSLDPSATRGEFAKAAICLMAFVAAAQLDGSRRSRRRVFACLALSGALVAGASLAAVVAGRASLAELRAVFINPNHLAGFLVLTSFVSAGLALSREERWRVYWLMAFAITGATVFLTLSRGGIGAFFVAATVLVFLWSRRQRAESPRLRAAAIPSAVVGLAIAVAAYLALESVFLELRSLSSLSDEVKPKLWLMVLAIVRDFPLVGIGRGAFSTVFPSYNVEFARQTYTHPENEWLQPLVEIGVPAGVLLVATIGLIWWRAARRSDLRSVEIGALAGSAGLAAHSLVDFSLELLGVALPFAVVLGLLTRGERSFLAGRRVVALCSGALLLASAIGIREQVRHAPDADARGVSAADTRRVTELARAAAAMHPADYLPHAIAGARLSDAGRCGEAMSWLTRAMLLSPTAPEPHQISARCLFSGGKPALAKRELRLAYTFGGSAVLGDVQRLFTDLADQLDCIPASADALLALGLALNDRRPADALLVFDRLWTEFGDERALAPLASLQLLQGRPEDALETSRVAERRSPEDPRGYVVAIKALSRLERFSDGQEALERGLAKTHRAPFLLLEGAEWYLSRKKYVESLRLARECIPKSPEEAAVRQTVIARALAEQGRLPEAEREARVATSSLPDRAWTWIVLATVYERGRRAQEAEAALAKAAAAPDADRESIARHLAALKEQRRNRADDQLEREIEEVSRAAGISTAP